ncbi:hypothetical protein FO526_31045, partial [Bacillus thuringiensis]|nr:hypothetical protein [Bacillus thuringiensis]
NMKMIKATGNDNVIFLHCVPAFHDVETMYGEEGYEKYGLKEMEVTDEIFRSKHTKVFDQAENRMQTMKGLWQLLQETWSKEERKSSFLLSPPLDTIIH